LKYSAAGRETQVRVYVFVLAAMSGGTDTGTIAVANKNASGTMGAMAALTNPQTIAGTGFTWYPSLGAFDPATCPYFNAYAGTTFDRVCLGARSSGATDKVQIRSVMFAVVPSIA
jgi:hypothetical protein